MFYNYSTRPYIVLNGKRSDSIPGLIISKLPPITKPGKRVMTETIDGRDGDIVTELGYSAYDKTIEVGLSYGYNVDDIIDYFNSSGKVVFSNEPDLYYNYAIYKQIDFTKLIRFKKATITFHTQPFKYSDSESEKTFDLSSGSGESVYIRNNGNFYSKPTLTIRGAGSIDLYINNRQILTLNLSAAGQTIIIDSEAMNAYNADRSALLNRLVAGNYDDVILKVGKNDISYIGSVSEIRVNNYSRWL